MNTEYLKKIRELLLHIENNMTPTIDAVAELCADAIAGEDT